MIEAIKARMKRHWPALRLRTILLAVLVFAGTAPGIGAVFLRVYENTLVRQTEAELVAQGAALASAAEAAWPGATPAPPANTRAPDYYEPEETRIDLGATPVLPERPPPRPSARPPEAEAFVAAQAIRPVIEGTVKTTLASVVVLDRRGRMVRGYRIGGDLSALPEVREALAGRPATVLRTNGDLRRRSRLEWLSRAATIRLHHARPIEVDGRVVGVVLLSRSPRALFRGLYEDRWRIAGGAAAVLALMIVLALLVSRGVTRPIEALSAAARDMAAGRGRPVEPPATAAVEIRALYEDFRQMAEAIDRRSRYLKDVAAAVSHEFKTPLAGITGAVELLQDHFETMTAAERRRFLGNIAADSERLSQLVGRLLDLARADMARPEAGEATGIEGPVRRVADAQAREDFSVGVTLEPGLPLAAISAGALEAVLGILLENSRQAGARHVRLTGALAPARGGAEIVLRLQDDGPGLAEADRERVFEPFFTSRRAEGGTGLGLPIARSLLAGSQGSIAALPVPAGALFEVRLATA